MATCPHCGQTMPEHMDADDLARRMRSGLDCYRGQDGHYYLTRGGGRVPYQAIDDALAHGLIVPKWDDAPDLEYWRAA